MHLWTRLGFHIAIPITYALVLVAVPSPAHALDVQIEAGCHAGLRTFHQQALLLLKNIRNYNDERSSPKYSPQTKLQELLEAIDGLPGLDFSFEIPAAKAAFLNIYSLFKPGLLEAVNAQKTATPPGEVALIGRLQTQNGFTGAINDICRQEQELTEARKTKVLNYFKSSPFFRGEITDTWSLTSKVNAIFSACTNILYLGGTTEAELRFPDSCQTQRNEYQELLTLRKFLDGKTTAHVSTIRDAWQKAGRSSPRTDLATLGDKKPEDILEVPTEAEVAGNETMIALAKAYHQVDFGPWYTHGNFVRDFTVAGTDTSSPLRTAIYYANFHDDVSPGNKGIKAANAHNMILFYADRIGEESGVGRNWLDEEKAKSSDFWAWDPAYVFAPKETKEFKPGGDWSFSAQDIRSDPDIKFQAALHYMSLKKCVSRREDMRKSTACVEAAKDLTKLPYPFNKGGTNTVHPHVAQGESGEPITALNAMNYIHRAFACNVRGSATARSAVYDLKYGWPSTATTRPAHPETVIKFCTNAERFDEPSTNESTIREVSMKGLPNLFSEAAGALRPASGLVAFHELQKVAAAKTPPQELFYMSLSQEKFIPKASDEHKWDAYTKDKSQGLDDINFRKVISFFGAEMLFMQQGSDIDVIQEIGKLKGMAQTPDNLLPAIFLTPTAATPMVTTSKLAGHYLNKVRSNWVSEMVFPLYHAYDSGSGGKTFGETVTFRSQKSAFEREDKLVHSAAFKLLMGLDPLHPPIMLNTTTGQVLSFLEWGSPLAEDRAKPSEEVAQIPMFLVGDYYKDLPAQGLFPQVGANLGDFSALIPSKNYGLTKDDIFIRKKDKDSDQIDTIPGSAVIGAMQALNMSIAEVIHRECTLQDEGFAQMMGRIRDCKNNPQAVPTPSPAAALATAPGGTPPAATPPSPPDPCLPRPYQVILDSVGGKKPEFDICKAMAVMATHYDEELKEGIPSCGVTKWVPWTECGNKQGPVMKWGMRLIGTAIILQAVFMILVDDGEKHWFWEWDKWKHTRFNPKDDDDRAAQQAAANITTRTTERRAASERAASTALQNLRSRVPSYSLRSSSSAVRRSRGNVRSGADAVKSAGGKGKAPASTSKSGRTGTKSLPGLNFRIGPSK